MSFIVNMGSDAIMKRFLVLAAVVSGAFAGGASMGAGNVEAGAGKAVACQACHGEHAEGMGAMPRLAGQHGDYLKKLDGERLSALVNAVYA